MSGLHALIANTGNDESATMHGQTGVTVGHEDLLGCEDGNLHNAPEVFAISTDCHQRSGRVHLGLYLGRTPTLPLTGTRCHDGGVTLRPGVLLRRGCIRRCPVCGSGGLFTRWFVMAPSCAGCGLVFRRAPGHWLGSWFLNVLVVQTVLVVGISVLVATTWPSPLAWYEIAGVVAAALAVPVVFFPFSRTLWTAIDLIMRPLDFDDGVAPGVELEQAALQRGEPVGPGLPD